MPQHYGTIQLGLRFGTKATLTCNQNTSISAVAVLCQPPGSKPIIDLYHNPHARLLIPHHLSPPLVRREYKAGHDDSDHRETSLYDLIFGSMPSAEHAEWFNDPSGKFRRELEKGIRELQARRNCDEM